MAEVSPLRQRMIEDMTHPQPLAGNTTILHLCGCQIQPPLWPLTGPAGTGGCARLPIVSDRAAAVVVAHQPGRNRYRQYCIGRIGRPNLRQNPSGCEVRYQ